MLELPGFNSSGFDQKAYNTLLRLEDMYKSVEEWRDLYITLAPILTTVGLVLNALCIVMFYKSTIFRNSSFRFYVYVIAVVDSLNILLRFAVPQTYESYLRHKLESEYHVKYMFDWEYERITHELTSEYHCNGFMYALNSLTLISVWLMVSVSFERWLIIKHTLQSKSMNKLRALLIITGVFMAMLTFNVLDLAPDLYNKPNWFANLTLVCERTDTFKYYDPRVSKNIVKRLGPVAFNTTIYSIIRALLQSMIPFSAVLVLNLLIIKNFKRIKAAAKSYGRSASMPSVASIGSSKRKHLISKAKSRLDQKTTLQQAEQEAEPHGEPEAVHFSLGGLSRSPSPFTTSTPNTPNTPTTPTSLVSALNLIERSNVPFKLAAHTPIPEEEANQSPVIKQLSSSHLMPPNLNQLQQKVDHDSTLNTTSVGEANSGSNASLGNASNLTTTTSPTLKEPDDAKKKKRIATIDDKSTNRSETQSLLVPKLLSRKVSNFRISRLSFRSTTARRIQLNRETDIMLIVLSFSILISQLPFTIYWFMVYYIGILHISFKPSIFDSAEESPKAILISRLLEIVYFSMNFFFYIALSPSLRKEIKKNVKARLPPVLKRYVVGKHLLNELSNGKVKDNSGAEPKSNEWQGERNKLERRASMPSCKEYDVYRNKLVAISPNASPGFCKDGEKTRMNNASKIRIVINDAAFDEPPIEETCDLAAKPLFKVSSSSFASSASS
nr:G protein-coupled receptor [Proales similis]